MPRIQDDEKRFREAIAKGATPAEAAKVRGVNKRSVGMFLRRLGMKPDSKPASKPAAKAKPRRTENTPQAMTAASYGHYPKASQAKEEKADE